MLPSTPLRTSLRRLPAIAAIAAFAAAALAQPAPRTATEEVLVTEHPPGRVGGRLVVALRTEPRTLNPLTASTDGASIDVVGRGGVMTADLIHINRASHLTEPALAREWSASADGRQYTLRLRRGIRFSDGDPFDADDVLFTFRAVLDERVRSPQRDLLMIGGKPVTFDKLDSHTVRVTLAQPYAVAERLFDGFAILPSHLLGPVYAAGGLPTAWAPGSNRATIAGLGPFRLKEYVPGERLVLERNPHYWKVDRAGTRLPYLDELVFLFVPTEDAQLLRFQSGETHLLNRISAENFEVLQREQSVKHYQLEDLGSGLEFQILLFNMNDLASKGLPDIAAKQRWFRNRSFRRAVSLAIDRDAIIRLAYRGRATPLWGNVSPGNRRWVNAALLRPERSIDRARALLREAGFTARGDALVDADGRPVEFSIIVSAANAQRVRMATIIQDDLRQLGMRVHVVQLEFRALLDRVFQTSNYEASVFSLTGGDADPNPQMNIWLSRGTSHLWNLGQKGPESPWETEVDSLMEQQLVTLDYQRRKQLYDRVQQILADELPAVFLASPNVLAAARHDVGNFRPAILDHQTLWNVDELFLRPAPMSAR
jgi:peptide/nickel transport system substrate-binding protein